MSSSPLHYLHYHSSIVDGGGGHMFHCVLLFPPLSRGRYIFVLYFCKYVTSFFRSAIDRGDRRCSIGRSADHRAATEIRDVVQHGRLLGGTFWAQEGASASIAGISRKTRIRRPRIVRYSVYAGYGPTLGSYLFLNYTSCCSRTLTWL